METKVNEISINGTVYVPKGTEVAKPGKRFVVVADRGWIFAGDVREADGRIKLTRAVHVRSWSSIGFDGMLADPKCGRVVIKPLPGGVDMPADCELFRVPVADEWGM